MNKLVALMLFALVGLTSAAADVKLPAKTGGEDKSDVPSDFPSDAPSDMAEDVGVQNSDERGASAAFQVRSIEFVGFAAAFAGAMFVGAV